MKAISDDVSGDIKWFDENRAKILTTIQDVDDNLQQTGVDITDFIKKADVRVVDIPVDVVRPDRFGVQSLRDCVRSCADGGQVMRPQQFNSFGGSQPLAGNGLIEDAFDLGRSAGNHGKRFLGGELSSA